MAATMKVRRAWNRFWYTPAPLGRVAWFARLIYLYVPFDLLMGRFVADHGLVPGSWYAPLWVGRLLHIPGPSASGMAVVAWSIVALCLVAAAGRGRRTAGVLVFLLYFYWCYIGFSYGKVDHDKVALLVALAVLPTVDWAGRSARVQDERAGWALRSVQVAVVLVYLLSAVTKLRVSGLSWLTSSILIFAIVRRGTMFADPLLNHPTVLHFMQAGILAFESTSPFLLKRSRIGRIWLAGAFAFHLASSVGIKIHFLPQVMCLFAFLPLERTADLAARIRGRILMAGREHAGVALEN